MTTTSSPPRTDDLLRRFVDVPFRAQTYRNLLYLLLAFPLGIAYFVAVVTGFSLGVGLLVTLVGVPILLLTIVGAVVLGGVEAHLARALVGVDVAVPSVLGRSPDDPAGTSPDRDDGLVAAVRRLLTAPTTWASVLLVFVKFVVGIVSFVALVTAAATSASMLAAPLLYDAHELTYNVGPYVVDTLPAALAVAGLGVVVAVVSLHVLNALARLHGLLTAALLGGDVVDW